MMGFELWSR